MSSPQAHALHCPLLVHWDQVDPGTNIHFQRQKVSIQPPKKEKQSEFEVDL